MTDSASVRLRSVRSMLASALLLAVLLPTTAFAEKPYFVMQRADYPAAALAARLEGDVPITLFIRDDGTIDKCVAEPGGSLAALKRASCVVIAQRGLFAPKIEKGKPVASTVAVIARWRILTVDDFSGGATPISPTEWVSTGDYPTEALGTGGLVVAQFDVDTNGRTANCLIEVSSGSPALDKKTCQLVLARGRYLPAVDADGQVRATRASFKVAWSP